MRCLVVGMALVAGCYSPSIAPGAPCESDCPGDLVCVDHVCREPGYRPGSDAAVTDAFVPIDTIDGPPGDGDADTIADASDNCPAKANTDQHDEDGDAVGDVCDPCPHLAGTTVDGDGDGVGDACDPQPAVAKQRIKFFDPFTADLSEWTQKSNVSRVGETLRFNATTSYASCALQVAVGESRIAVAGTIATVIANAPEHQLTLSFGHNATGSVYHYTEFYDTGGPGEIAISRANNGVYTSLSGAPYSGALPVGAWSMRTDSSVSAQRITLATTLGGTSRPTLSATITSPALTTSTKIELGVQGSDVRLDYFLVIETLP